MTTINEVLKSIQNMSTEELLSINKALCATIKLRNAMKQIAAGSEFKVGDKVQFNQKRGGCVEIEITGFNRARTSAKGFESGNKMRTWTVSCNLLTKAAS